MAKPLNNTPKGKAMFTFQPNGPKVPISKPATAAKPAAKKAAPKKAK